MLHLLLNFCLKILDNLDARLTFGTSRWRVVCRLIVLSVSSGSRRYNPVVFTAYIYVDWYQHYSNVDYI